MVQPHQEVALVTRPLSLTAATYSSPVCSPGQVIVFDIVFLISLINWVGAKQTCEDLHAHLVKIETEEENEELYNEAVRLNMTSESWIGLSDAAEEGNWVWTSGERAKFTKWSTAEPNNSQGKENCAVLYTFVVSHGKWNDVPCQSQRGAICELIM